MTFFELTCPVSKTQLSVLDQVLTQLGAVGITYTDAKNNPIYEPLPGEMPLWDDVRLTALFDDLQLFNVATQWVRHELPQLEVVTTQLKDQVWERLWMDYFKPMQFGKNSWIIPDGFDLVDEQAVNLVLDPGLAFGTGTHPTTALCLNWLDRNNVKDKFVVDFGCGSGVLAIMALLHGARSVICVDIDDQAIEATWQNARKNGVERGIQIVAPDQVGTIKNQDLVMANILAAPLMSLCDTFAKMLSDYGEVVLSGIITDQATTVIDKYRSRFIDIRSKIEQDWCRVSARKR